MITIFITVFFYPLLLLLLPTPTTALQVTPGSPCAPHCLDIPTLSPFLANSSTTNASDIVCTDAAFSSTDIGKKFASCLECLQKSDKVDAAESDLGWFLGNLRFALGMCLFESDGLADGVRVDSPCLTPSSCAPLDEAVTGGDVERLVEGNGYGNDTDELYSFCDSGVLEGKWEGSCVECLRSTEDQTYLANFFTTLQSACLQKPTPGTLLSLSGPIFSTTPLNVTNTTTTTSSSSDGNNGSSTINTPTIVGISVGASLTLLGGIALFWVYFRRQRRAPPALPSSPADSTTSGDNLDKKIITSSASSVSTFVPPMYEMSLHPSLASTINIPGSVPLAPGFAHSRSTSAASYHTMTSTDHNLARAVSVATVVPQPHPAYIPGCTSRSNTPSIRTHSPSPSSSLHSRTPSNASVHSNPSLSSPPRKRKPSPLTIETNLSSSYAVTSPPKINPATAQAYQEALKDPEFVVPRPPLTGYRGSVTTVSGSRRGVPGIAVQGASPIVEVDEAGLR